MNTYLIRRRSNWETPAELEAAAAVSSRIGNEEMPDRVRWIRSYVVQEEDGRLGTLCVYEATDEQSIDEHAFRVGMSADDILPVKATVVVRDDPTEDKGQAA